MVSLGRARLIKTKKGSASPRLTRSAEQIPLVDIYVSITDERSIAC
ncbi:hypothetical protein [Liquorilactobacillus uvarum]|nr:hypothetical protein [Liquorilactobacillus uvarum]